MELFAPLVDHLSILNSHRYLRYCILLWLTRRNESNRDQFFDERSCLFRETVHRFSSIKKKYLSPRVNNLRIVKCGKFFEDSTRGRNIRALFEGDVSTNDVSRHGEKKKKTTNKINVGGGKWRNESGGKQRAAE